jgi:conjugative relaxase-like TrwC/TraI family protein
MIRMIQSKSAAHAKAYFKDALLKSDYYTNDQELTGYWQGSLGVRLGLDGEVSKDEFFAMCENRHPQLKTNLTPRTKDERTTGYDINFHCPKSVSIVHALANDERIIDAFKDSVKETMLLIEADAKTRVRKQGQYDERDTGELVWANFIHQTARPVKDQMPDPHLHSHCFVFNATWDKTEKEFKAVQFRDIKRDMPYYQAAFHKNFSDKLMELGYGIKATAKSFEIESVPQDVIDLFSKRTDEIGRVAKQLGITDVKELAELGARTRAKKQKGHSMEELKNEWKEQVSEQTKVNIEEVAKPSGKKIDLNKITPKMCVDHAVLHCFERTSVMHDRRLLENAYKRSLGNPTVGLTDINKVFKGDDRFIHIYDNGKMMCTTKEVLSEEKHMVRLAMRGQGKVLPLYPEAPQTALLGQQKDAADDVLTNSHRISIIRGSAGTGKTFMTTEIVNKINQAGKQVTVVAPTANASRGVLREEGFKEADTVAKLIADKEMQSKLKDQVLIVDEAGLLGTKDMTSLLDIVEQQNARLILIGDTRQHASVVRGDALRILNTQAQIKVAEVSKNYRQQKKDYREAVDDLAKGKVEGGFKKLDAMGAIKTIDPLGKNKELVNDYVDALKRKKRALVISPTHAHGEEMTQAIRQKLREEKMLGKKEITVTQYANLNFTEAEKGDVRNYKAGLVIQFTQNAKGFKRGSQWIVEYADEKIVRIKNEKGSKKILPTHEASKFAVFMQKGIAVSKKDRLRITVNSFTKDKERFDNGTLLEVVSVSKNGEFKVRKQNSRTEYTLAKNFGHIAHAHCITSYASQGKTVDQVFISQPAETFAATDAKQFYVSVSRAKESVVIYTNDKKELLEAAKDLSQRQSAMELTNGKILSVDFLRAQDSLLQKTENKNVTEKEKRKNSRGYEPEL